MPIKEAVEAPRIHHQWIPDELNVEDKLPPETKKSLERRGHAVEKGLPWASCRPSSPNGSKIYRRSRFKKGGQGAFGITS